MQLKRRSPLCVVADALLCTTTMEVPMTDRINHRLYQLDVLERNTELRQVACWAAKQTYSRLEKWRFIVTHIQENAHDPDIHRFCYHAREEMKGAACGAAVIGMRVSPASANSVMACMACTRADPLESAEQAIEHIIRWHEAVMETEDTAIFEQHIEDKLDAVWKRISR